LLFGRAADEPSLFVARPSE